MRRKHDYHGGLRIWVPQVVTIYATLGEEGAEYGITQTKSKAGSVFVSPATQADGSAFTCAFVEFEILKLAVFALSSEDPELLGPLLFSFDRDACGNSTPGSSICARAYPRPAGRLRGREAAEDPAQGSAEAHQSRR